MNIENLPCRVLSVISPLLSVALIVAVASLRRGGWVAGPAVMFLYVVIASVQIIFMLVVCGYVL